MAALHCKRSSSRHVPSTRSARRLLAPAHLPCGTSSRLSDTNQNNRTAGAGARAAGALAAAQRPPPRRARRPTTHLLRHRAGAAAAAGAGSAPPVRRGIAVPAAERSDEREHRHRVLRARERELHKRPRRRRRGAHGSVAPAVAAAEPLAGAAVVAADRRVCGVLRAAAARAARAAARAGACRRGATRRPARVWWRRPCRREQLTCWRCARGAASRADVDAGIRHLPASSSVDSSSADSKCFVVS